MNQVRNEVTGQTHELSMSHYWPVRMPRPTAEKLPGNVALTTGLRVVDALFPSVRALGKDFFLSSFNEKP